MRHLNRYIVYAVLGPLLGLGVNFTAQAELVVIVHPSNPVNALSHTQVQKLFLGRSLMFPDTEAKVYSIDQDESSLIFKRFYETVIQINISKLKKYRAYYLFSGRGRLPLSLDSTNEVIDRVSRTENAISYVDLKDASDKVKVVYTMP